MPSVEESVCCQEVQKVKTAASEGVGEPHSASQFTQDLARLVWLHMLKVAYTYYRQQHGQMEEKTVILGFATQHIDSLLDGAGDI